MATTDGLIRAMVSARSASARAPPAWSPSARAPAQVARRRSTVRRACTRGLLRRDNADDALQFRGRFRDRRVIGMALLLIVALDALHVRARLGVGRDAAV